MSASEMNLPSVQHQSGALVAVEQQRAIAEVQAAMILARQFPRDQAQAYARIMDVCKRKTLAEVSQYTYSRGGTSINGPSIRLAEAIAQEWGNVEYGIRELEQRPGASVMEAYAWDIERNVRERRVFTVKHVRDTRKGSYALDDQRDIYELAANLGKRRQRACLLAIIPGDIVEAAINQCNATLEGDAKVPIADLAREILAAFSEYGVTKEMIEKRLQHSLDALTRLEAVQLRKVYVSIKDGFAGREQYFEIPGLEPEAAEQAPQTDAERIMNLGKRVKPAQPAPVSQQPEEESAKGTSSVDIKPSKDEQPPPIASPATGGGLFPDGDAPPDDGELYDIVKGLVRDKDYDAAADMASKINDPVLFADASKIIENARKGKK